MKKNKIKIYQADFIFMLGDQAKEFDNCIIWKWGKITKKKYSLKYGHIYSCKFRTEDDGVNCLIECLRNDMIVIATNQKVKWVKEK